MFMHMSIAFHMGYRHFFLEKWLWPPREAIFSARKIEPPGPTPWKGLSSDPVSDPKKRLNMCSFIQLLYL